MSVPGAEVVQSSVDGLTAEAPIEFEQVVQAISAQSLPASYSAIQLKALSPISLAYIGDAVFELYVRSQLLIPAKRIRDYHRQTVAHVKAEQQSEYVDVLTPHLNADELDMLRKGRNATTGRSRRADAKQYQKATGFEALIGFLYLSDRARMLSLLAILAIK